MRRLAIVVVCALLSTPAAAQSVGEKTGVNSMLGITPTTADFVKEVAISGMFEIESSKLAEQKGDAGVKDFAGQMVTDHTKTSTQLSSEAQAAGVPLPNEMSTSLLAKLDRLRTLSGSEFTKEYVDDQISAHQQAVSLFERYGKAGDSAKLREWAVTTLPALQHHLEMAQALKK